MLFQHRVDKKVEYAGERDEAEFWQAARPRREPARARWFLPGVLLALVVSVPFYWGASTPAVAGLPLWVWVAVGCSAVVSALTASAAWFGWDDPDQGERSD